MMQVSLPVLLEDNHLLVINKPAGLATMGAPEGTETAVTWARRYLKDRYQKPGNVYVGVVSRLDALVSGVLVLARTSKAAARLSAQFAQATPDKRYLAVVDGPILPLEGTWVDQIEKDDRAQRMFCTRQSGRGQRAELRFRRLANGTPGGLRGTRRPDSPADESAQQRVQIELITGRKHQIRVQFASRGCPILGDHKYGSPRDFPQGIALHAHRLQFEHPVTHQQLEITAPLPAYWRKFWPDDVIVSY